MTEAWVSYLKIAEGCSNNCTYCVIPKLRGLFKSRRIENLVEEAKVLASKGVKEIIIIAQDTSKYGIDIYGEKNFMSLFERFQK